MGGAVVGRAADNARPGENEARADEAAASKPKLRPTTPMKTPTASVGALDATKTPRDKQGQNPPLRLATISLEISERAALRISSLAGEAQRRAEQDRHCAKDFEARKQPETVAALEADAKISEEVAAVLRQISTPPPSRK